MTLVIKSVTWTDVITTRDLLSNAGKINNLLGLIVRIISILNTDAGGVGKENWVG